MARIKISDLPESRRVSQKEMKRVMGGVLVFANLLSVVHKTSGGITSVFPDVCLTPSPGSPIPIPYPNIGMSSDDAAGSKDTKT
jgi:hypothetical protein